MVPQYRTSRFHLRPVADSDFAVLFRNFSDPAMMKFYDLPSVKGMEDVEELVGRWRRWESKGAGMRWAIALNDSGRMIGSCGFHDINRQANCAEIGCEVSREFWGRRVVPEVAPLLGHFAFDVLSLHHVNAFVAPGNRSTIALLKAFGFRRRRLLKGHRLIDGQRADMLAFAITRAAYRAGKRSRLMASAVTLPAAARDACARLAYAMRARASRQPPSAGLDDCRLPD